MESWLGWGGGIVTAESQLKKCPRMTSRQVCSAFSWLTFEKEGPNLLRTMPLLGRQQTALTAVRQRDEKPQGVEQTSKPCFCRASASAPTPVFLCTCHNGPAPGIQKPNKSSP